MNKSAIIIKFDEVEVPETTLSKIAALLHEECDVTKINVQVLSQKDIDEIVKKVVLTDPIGIEPLKKRADFTPEENAAVFISGVFDNDFTDMFPTRLAVKLMGRTETDPLVKAVKIIGNTASSYNNISKDIQRKYNFTMATFYCIKSVAKMMYDNV